jgi:hypothetical protein
LLCWLKLFESAVAIERQKKQETSMKTSENGGYTLSGIG